MQSNGYGIPPFFCWFHIVIKQIDFPYSSEVGMTWNKINVVFKNFIYFGPLWDAAATKEFFRTTGFCDGNGICFQLKLESFYVYCDHSEFEYSNNASGWIISYISGRLRNGYPLPLLTFNLVSFHAFMNTHPEKATYVMLFN